MTTRSIAAKGDFRGGDSPAVLEIDNLSLSFRHNLTLVHNVSMTIDQGAIVGVVGESGSGKTLTARAAVGLAPPDIVKTAGSIKFLGRDLDTLGVAEMRQLRGPGIGFIFQDPMTSLNPSMRIGDQLDESLRLHGRGDARARTSSVFQILEQVGIGDPRRAVQAWPHQFSGGMRQRIMIASAMLLKPKLIVADEPTTALDAIVQRGVMELMLRLARENATAVMLISHDLPMVAHYCERVCVMKEGRIVEAGPTARILETPAEEYTRALLGAIPTRAVRDRRDEGKPLVRVCGLKVSYPTASSRWLSSGDKAVLKGIDLEIGRGEVVAVVGESGSGKTTLGKAIAGLVKWNAGEIHFDGVSLQPGKKMPASLRRDLQFVFQDPHSSLDPRMTVRQSLAEALRVDRLSAQTRREKIREVLADVGLSEAYLDRLPHQLSGGQKQRVAIARAIIRRPRFIVADEAVSALDVTIRAQILKLFANLQSKFGFSCLFVSHDLGAVQEVADRAVVMQGGMIAEQGTIDEIFDRPKTDYTKKLLLSLPILQKTENGVKLDWRQI